MEYKFTIQGKLNNLNDYTKACRTHRIMGSKMKEENEAIVTFYLMQQLKDLVIDKPVIINYYWYEPNKKRDLDNIAFAKKFIQDALVKRGILKNDGWKQIKGFTDNFFVDKDNPHVDVIIKEIDE